jgi:hypothetical protein
MKKLMGGTFMESIHAYGQRWFYEIILKYTHSHPYLDVEYLVRRDSADPDRHEKYPDLCIMLIIVRDVKVTVYAAYGINAEIILLQRSRVYDGIFPNIHSITLSETFPRTKITMTA